MHQVRKKMSAAIVATTMGLMPVYKAGAEGQAGSAVADGAVQAQAAAVSVEPLFNGGRGAAVKGAFGPVFKWPVIPIHLVLQPDGRVLGYGTDERGAQGAQLKYAVWDPAQGTSAASMTLLENATNTDIFCGGQIVIPSTGETLIAGGDMTVNGIRNYAQNETNFFDYRQNAMIKSNQPMSFKRWYPTVLTLANGEQIILGGQLDKGKSGFGTHATTPEIFNTTTGWRTLDGATSENAFDTGQNWYYPRAWLAPNGKVFVLAASTGEMFYLDAAGKGSIKKVKGVAASGSSAFFPSAMYAPGKILSVRGQSVFLVDINGETPVITTTSPLSQPRYYATTTVMADGRVLVNGGSGVQNALISVAYKTEIWSPRTGRWTLGADGAKPRLYHSTALLLPDATVLTGGGGAPGPLKNLNAEIYYPPYLFKKDGSGQFAPRPEILKYQPEMALGGAYSMVMKDKATQVSRVTLVRTGSNTHAWNNDQRFQQLEFVQKDRHVYLKTPANPNITPPGYYLLFVFDQAGVPSVAKIIHVGS